MSQYMGQNGSLLYTSLLAPRDHNAISQRSLTWENWSRA